MTDIITWPNFFHVGPGKTGTSTIYRILRGIRGMYVPPVEEAAYFTRRITKKQYLSLYGDVTDEKILADTSHYYSSNTACQRIRAVRPDAKILISLRDPVEQLFSWFLAIILRWQSSSITLTQRIDRFIDDDYGTWKRNNINHDGDLLDIRKSNKYYYSEPLSMWISAFGRQNVKVILLEDLIQNPRDTVADLLDFVGGGCTADLDSFTLKTYNSFHVHRFNVVPKILNNISVSTRARIPLGVRTFVAEKILSKAAEKPQMNPQDRRRLREFLQDDVSETERILGRRLPWKNFRSCDGTRDQP